MKRVTVATSSAAIALFLIEEAVWGLALSLLPAEWRVVSDRALLTVAVILLLVTLTLLWSIARNTAQAVKEYRKSNERSHRNDALFEELRDAHAQVLLELQGIRAELGRVTAAFTANNERLERLETDRERSYR